MSGGIERRAHLAAVVVPMGTAEPDVEEELHELEAISRGLTQHTLADNTRRAYRKAWRAFESFCSDHGLDVLPAHPEAVRWYVAWMSVQADAAGLPRFSVATIRQHLAGIADRHLQDGYLDPTGHRAVGDLVRGLSKLRATRPNRKRPLLLDDVRRLISGMDHDVYPVGLSSTRDAAAIWLGFAGALRRSEAAALRMDSVELNADDGVYLHVGKSKADQDNTRADVVVLPYGSSPATCAPCALHRWIRLTELAAVGDDRERRRAFMRQLYGYQLEEHVCGAEGSAGLISSASLSSTTPLLRATYRNRRSGRIHDAGVSGDALHSMLRSRLEAIGVNPEPYGFHSLRAGHVTQARRNGASTEEIMRAGRWQKAETVNVYDREYNPAARNSVTRLGL